MFDFAYPQYLYLLALIPFFVLLYMTMRASRRAKLRRFGRPEVIASLMPDSSRYTPAIKITLAMLALAALVIMVARPRAGAKEQTETSAGIEVMIAFDVSNSMLASSTDKPDGVSRLDRARLLLEKLIDRLNNDKVGLVIFAGEPKMQLPLTADFYTAKMYLNELNPQQITYQGTDIAGAIKMAMNGFSPAEDMHKAIILITDAEDHEGAAVDAARLARENGIQVDVIGLGTAGGTLLPGFTTPEGTPVITKRATRRRNRFGRRRHLCERRLSLGPQRTQFATRQTPEVGVQHRELHSRSRTIPHIRFFGIPLPHHRHIHCQP